MKAHFFSSMTQGQPSAWGIGSKSMLEALETQMASLMLSGPFWTGKSPFSASTLKVLSNALDEFIFGYSNQLANLVTTRALFDLLGPARLLEAITYSTDVADLEQEPPIPHFASSDFEYVLKECKPDLWTPARIAALTSKVS